MTISEYTDCLVDAPCRAAATRAYDELKSHGVKDPRAFGAAVRVFQHHHPEAPARDAHFIVADWLDPEA
jgi:hypothetical protein